MVKVGILTSIVLIKANHQTLSQSKIVSTKDSILSQLKKQAANLPMFLEIIKKYSILMQQQELLMSIIFFKMLKTDQSASN